jgi:hypothetical protein
MGAYALSIRNSQAMADAVYMLFYRNLLAAAFELTPDETMRAVTDVVTSFQMPGHTIDGFRPKSVAIANAGIYDLRLHHDEVLTPILRQWRVFELESCTRTETKHAKSSRSSCKDSTRRRTGSSNAARNARPSRRSATGDTAVVTPVRIRPRRRTREETRQVNHWLTASRQGQLASTTGPRLASAASTAVRRAASIHRASGADPRWSRT